MNKLLLKYFIWWCTLLFWCTQKILPKIAGVRSTSIKVLGVRKIFKILEVYALYQNWCSLSMKITLNTINCECIKDYIDLIPLRGNDLWGTYGPGDFFIWTSKGISPSIFLFTAGMKHYLNKKGATRRFLLNYV
jgi:hypothetical protein